MILRLGIVALLLACAVPAAAAPVPAAPADTASAAVFDPAAEPAAALRGTSEPLDDSTGFGRKALGAVGTLPYGLMELAFRPVIWTVQLQENYDLLGKLEKLVVWDVASVDTRFSYSFGWESGFGWTVAGVKARSQDWLGTGIDFTTGFSYLSPDDMMLSFAMDLREGPWDLAVLARSVRRNEDPFYGVGMETENRRYDAQRRASLLEIGLGRRMALGLRLFGSVWAREITLVDPGHGPWVSDGFPELFAVASQSDYVGIEAGLEIDRRDEGEFSTRGGLVRLTGGTADARSAPHSAYRHYSLELQKFFNVYRGDRSLAVRLFCEGMDREDPSQVPYTEMGRLGGRRWLRGYEADRFTGACLALATVEYRYPLTHYLQGRIFGDWGAAAGEWDRMKLDELARSQGFALVYHQGPFAVAAQIAWSEEGTQLYLGTGSVFQLPSRRLR